jgi:hypothetical protein
MRYADAHTQRQFDQLQRAAGRPLDSPGWGKLIAVKTGAYVSERNPADHTTIEAGSTHVCRDYWLARERPELFKPADNRDARTYREHSANLERARKELERRLPASRRGRATRPAKSGTLTLPGQPFRLPRNDRPFRLPRAVHRKVLP